MNASGNRFGGFCAGVDAFDAALFSMPPAEAAAIDPQQRILMEQTALALASATDTLGREIGASTGVFQDPKALNVIIPYVVLSI